MGSRHNQRIKGCFPEELVERRSNVCWAVTPLQVSDFVWRRGVDDTFKHYIGLRCQKWQMCLSRPSAAAYDADLQLRHVIVLLAKSVRKDAAGRGGERLAGSLWLTVQCRLHKGKDIRIVG